MATVLEEFKRLAAMGLNVIPLHGLDTGKTAGKLPFFGWRHSTHADGLAILLRHPESNLGLATSDRGLRVFVLDVDGPVGEKSLAALVARLGPLPETISSRTPRLEGGRHLFFAYPATGEIPRNTASKLGPKLDIRGEGGFAVLPPSKHRSGGIYTWLPGCAPGERQFEQIPAAWVKAICIPRVVRRVRSLAETPGLDVEADAVRKKLRHIRAEDTRELIRKVLDGEVLAEAGSRNAELHRAISTMLYACPEAADSQLLEIVRPCVEAMAAAGSRNTGMEKAADMLVRERALREIKKAAEKAQDEALGRAMFTGQVPAAAMKVDDSEEAKARRRALFQPSAAMKVDDSEEAKARRRALFQPPVMKVDDSEEAKARRARK